MPHENRKAQMEALKIRCADQVRQSHIEHYTNSWGDFADSILRALSSGKEPHFVMDAFDKFQNRYEGFVPKWFTNQVPVTVSMDLDQTPPRRLHVAEGTYVSTLEDEAEQLQTNAKTAMLDLISSYVDNDVDCIVEFGSGLGFNLAKLRNKLSPSTSDQRIKYIACEPTTSGRIATEAIFAAYNYENVETIQFDYVKSNLDFLSDYNKVMAFTCHSIEQVAFISDFFEFMMKSNIFSCVHMEPIGWQRIDKQYDLAIDLMLNNKTDDIIVSPENMEKNSAIWAAKSHHNVDLLSCIMDNSKQWRIHITEPRYDFFGGAPFNPSTLVGWSKL